MRNEITCLNHIYDINPLFLYWYKNKKAIIEEVATENIHENGTLNFSVYPSPSLITVRIKRLNILSFFSVMAGSCQRGFQVKSTFSQAAHSKL